jgi:hypothetical protein
MFKEMFFFSLRPTVDSGNRQHNVLSSRGKHVSILSPGFVLRRVVPDLFTPCAGLKLVKFRFSRFLNKDVPPSKISGLG